MVSSLDEQNIGRIKEESYRFSLLRDAINSVIVGHENIIQFMLIAILCDGHILLEGVPGVAKTTMIKALTNALGLSFKRIQFTPDLLPADLIGTLIYNPKTQEFETKKGPIFAHLILADEINRAPAKVQAALLEAMQEKQVTIGSSTYNLVQPFLVFATQNPLEQEGTYRLPEAQVDRFIFKVCVTYPTPVQEKIILKQMHDVSSIKPVLNQQDIFLAQELVRNIFVDEKIIDYIVSIVASTRNPHSYNIPALVPYIQYGVSPRASIGLYNAARAHAFLHKRHFVVPDDVKAVAPAILGHRLTLSYEAEAEEIHPYKVIDTILNTIESP